LSGELAYGDCEDRGAILLIGPHPYMGGTMDNNVLSVLAGVLAAAGFVTLRFNYRALAGELIAESMLSFWTTGHAPQDMDLVEESRIARNWLRAQLDQAVSVIGYSFGAYAASEIIDDQTPAAVLIAPTVKHHELAALRTSVVPKLVIYSSDDFATAQLATESWFAGLAVPKRKACFVGGNHFFRGEETALAAHVREFLENTVAVQPGVVKS